ncbi:glutamate racemase [Fructilactobacillus lindneri]|uniref:Glutamate racemase n=2 Tax=Fructilactobacillus lindneri TaxID=53444 RepID=A0A0R2JPV5_9LACO|nr:glutamate racemase [Fructilactobacillus lindneri]ANZ58322.1 glutamate racemase [Fructilactobacillus lindneri]ANZ59644.1 glutamate racemase [Fructilactobacillus lindneri]KRN79155.1 glutamate racemase [Fructilactobacillus lindneri DSM 20690 = JCM 11027]POG98572.1 glutamate racemase [Fructilactobacillus lindneri]POH03960.1 glutamate racemase [Fructilactobacillus lindneri]
MNSAPIAFMDSGIGGLTVLKLSLKELPKENTLYLGDEAHLPYGEKKAGQVINYATEIGHFFEKKHAKFMIIACNTASATALSRLQTELAIPVIGVIEPGSRAAIKVSKNKKIGIIGTSVTVKSHAYRDAIKKIDSNAEVIEVACPTFIPLVEKGDYTSPEAKQIINDGLKNLKNTGIDTLILGCTHFPIVANLIQAALGDKVTLINPGFETVETAKQMLQNQSLLNDKTSSKNQFYTTSGVEHFDEVASQWLNRKVKAELILPNELKSYEE